MHVLATVALLFAGTALSEKIAQKADTLAFLFDQLGMSAE